MELGQFSELDQGQLSGCIVIHSCKHYCPFRPSPGLQYKNKAAHLFFRPKSRVDLVLERMMKSLLPLSMFTNPPPPPPNHHYHKYKSHLNNIAYLINFSRLHSLCQVQKTAAATSVHAEMKHIFYTAAWLTGSPCCSCSVHCCKSATNDTDKVSFTLCIVDSLKKNFPNIVLVKQDCSTARMQTIMHTFLQWRKQACDVNSNPQTVFLLYHHLNFFFFQEWCDKEFHFGWRSQLCPLANWEHNSQFLWIIKTEGIFGLFTKCRVFPQTE